MCPQPRLTKLSPAHASDFAAARLPSQCLALPQLAVRRPPLYVSCNRISIPPFAPNPRLSYNRRLANVMKMTDIHLHNTLSGRLEPLEPLHQGEVRIYSCGPTVYDYAHIGNFRTFVFQDVLRRFLLFRGLASCR